MTYIIDHKTFRVFGKVLDEFEVFDLSLSKINTIESLRGNQVLEYKNHSSFKPFFVFFQHNDQ